MPRNQRVQFALSTVLGLTIGTVIAGLLDWIPLSVAAISIPIAAVFAVAMTSRLFKMNAHVLSVGFWLATGMILVPLVARLLNLGQYLGWIALVWLTASVVVGTMWPLPNARKQAGKN